MKNDGNAIGMRFLKCFRWLIDIISIEIASMFSKMCYVLQMIDGRYFPVSLDVYIENEIFILGNG